LASLANKCTFGGVHYAIPARPEKRVFVPEQKPPARFLQWKLNPAAKQVLRKVRLHSAFPGRRPCQETQEEDSFFTPQAVGHPMAGSRGGHVEVPRAAEPAAQRSGVAAAFRGGISAACRIHRAQFFDLILQALQLPAGSEIIMSALTIREMADIAAGMDSFPCPRFES